MPTRSDFLPEITSEVEIRNILISQNGEDRHAKTQLVRYHWKINTFIAPNLNCNSKSSYQNIFNYSIQTIFMS